MRRRSEILRWAIPAGAVALGLAAFIAIGIITDDDGDPAGSAFGGKVECVVRDDARVCGEGTATVESFDGTPIDVSLLTPRDGDGPFPLLLSQGGWPGGKFDAEALKIWPPRGYAVLSIANRGLGESGGFTHFMDTRFEVRDAQELIGALVDEGIADPDRIGAFGGSYGGGQALALGALRNRVMEPDGSLAPWQSPKGTPISVAVAIGQTTWSDLADALLPNGSSLDFVAEAPYRAPAGPLKQSWATSLYETGKRQAEYGGGQDPLSNFESWYLALTGGGGLPRERVAAEMFAHHSAAGIDDSVAPAPTLMVSGLSDDLFPADQSIAYMNQITAHHPETPVGVVIGDVGHARAQNEDDDRTLALTRGLEWLDHYLLDEGEAPPTGVEIAVQTCDGDSGDALDAEEWSSVAAGEVRFAERPPRRIAPALSETATGAAFDPFAGEGACAEVPATVAQGRATYTLPPAAEGYTLAGAPLVTAEFDSRPGSQVAARLLDVDPNGTARLVARALWMPIPAGGRQVFELNPTAWKFEEGHSARLELLPADPPYGQVLPAQAQVTVSELELRLPVLEEPGSAGGAVREVAPKPVPPGYEPAPGVQ